MLTIETILAYNKKNHMYNIDDCVREYLYYIYVKPFYIETSFTEIEFKEKLSAKGYSVRTV